MFRLNNINHHIKYFNYRSQYFDYFKELNKPLRHMKNGILYECIDSFIDNFNVTIPTFSEFICKKIDDSHFKDEVELYKNAGIERQRWSDLINNKSERPKKDTLFKIALSLKLTIDETDTLLATKGYCINHNLYRDKLISYFFIDPDGKEILNLNPMDRNIEINNILEERHQAPLY